MKHKAIIAAMVVTSLILGGCCDWCKDKCKEECVDTKPADTVGAKPADTKDVSKATDTGPANAGFSIEDAHGNQANGKLWVVTDRIDQPHMAIGDTFRIKKAGAQVTLIPLALLRARWAQAGMGFNVPLIETGGAENKYCGAVEIPTDEHPLDDEFSHGPPHIMMIKVVSENEVEVGFFLKNDSVTLAEQCVNTPFHGGRAHAEN